MDDEAPSAAGDRQQRILDATLSLLAQHGIAGVSIRSVAREAGVALGLVNYYFTDKIGLVRAALERIESQDLALVAGDPDLPPEDRLRDVLRRVAAPEYLTTDYLSLRLQLWSLAQVHPDFAELNASAQQRYRDGLADLITAARPDLDADECARRAADVDVVQNGLWLTALLGLDTASTQRALDRSEAIALGD